MLVNVDITSGVMYRPGTLIDLCLEFFGRTNPNILDPRSGLPERERHRLQRFVSGMRVLTRRAGLPNRPPVSRSIRKLTSVGADQLSFSMRDGGKSTVADYFRQNNQTLRFPGLICVEVYQLNTYTSYS